MDTAGLRETTDIVENMGIRKTHEKIDEASVILLIEEISDTAEAINIRAEAIREKTKHSEKRLIILINKSDTVTPEYQASLKKMIRVEDKERLHFISAMQNTGLDELRVYLGEIIEKDKLNSGDIIITNIRHYEALLHVSEGLSRVLDGLENNIPEDLIAIDIRQSIYYLGEITGEITTDEILGNIFKNFCIGK
jgi:tRNA modification GTPase